WQAEGYRRPVASIASIAAGRCSGANRTAARRSASTPSSSTVCRVWCGPPWTTRWPTASGSAVHESSSSASARPGSPVAAVRDASGSPSANSAPFSDDDPALMQRTFTARARSGGPGPVGHLGHVLEVLPDVELVQGQHAIALGLEFVGPRRTPPRPPQRLL